MTFSMGSDYDRHTRILLGVFVLIWSLHDTEKRLTTPRRVDVFMHSLYGAIFCTVMATPSWCRVSTCQSSPVRVLILDSPVRRQALAFDLRYYASKCRFLPYHSILKCKYQNTLCSWSMEALGGIMSAIHPSHCGRGYKQHQSGPKD